MAVARLPATQAAVVRALAIAQLFAEDAGLPDSARDTLSIVIEEWTMNIVEHGLAAPDSLIALRIERIDDLVRLTVSDAGQPFDPREAVSTGPNLERGGGVGLDLIRAWTRIESYRRRAGRNQLVLGIPLP